MFFMFYHYSNSMAMLDFYSTKHSKTECTVRSFGLIATCYLETSLVQGVHHAGVAVELEHMLKNNKLVMILLTRLLFNFTTYYFNLAECIRILLVIWKLGKSLHHAGVAVKVNHSMVKCLDKIIFSLSSYEDLAECNWNNLRLVSGSMMKTSLAKVMQGSHSGQLAIREADEEDDPGFHRALQEDAEPKLLLVVGVLQLFEDEYSVWVLPNRIFHTRPCGG